nr:MAG TPA: Herpesvirus UL47 protein [Bacteriophage sp.]
MPKRGPYSAIWTSSGANLIQWAEFRLICA